MSPRRSLRHRAMRATPQEPDSNMETRSNRLTRSSANSSPPVTIFRAPVSPGQLGKSLRLIIKMRSSKLREATNASKRNIFTEDPIVIGPRTSRPRKKLVEINTSDEENLSDQEEDEVDDDDAAGDEDKDADADGDLDMDDAPPQPPSRRHARAAATSTPSRRQVKSVEAKEMEVENDDDDGDDDDDDDDELSELGSDAEGEPDDDGNAELDEEDEEGLDSDDANADIGKMTKRQRGSLGNDFLQLPMEPQIKKHLTAEERAMRRAEMARRRKNLSEKRNEEEKMDTINRLLRKQPPKKRGRGAAEGADAIPGEQEAQELQKQKADPTMIRWVSNRQGSQLSVPEEWLGTPAGRLLGENQTGSRKLVEEV